VLGKCKAKNVYSSLTLVQVKYIGIEYIVEKVGSKVPIPTPSSLALGLLKRVGKEVGALAVHLVVEVLGYLL
jgi:hypothetical protein